MLAFVRYVLCNSGRLTIPRGGIPLYSGVHGCGRCSLRVVIFALARGKEASRDQTNYEKRNLVR